MIKVFLIPTLPLPPGTAKSLRNRSGRTKIDFIQSSAECTIRSLPSRSPGENSHHSNPVEDGSHSWDLITEDEWKCLWGVIYHVDAPDWGGMSVNLQLLNN